MNAEQKTTRVETTEETAALEGNLITVDVDKTGEHLPRIREDMSLRSVKFQEMDQSGHYTGKLITLEGYFSRLARNVDESKGLSYTLGSFAVAVADTNADLSPEAQVAVFRSLCVKGAEKAFPMVAATDDWGNVLYQEGTDQPILKSTVPNSYKSMISNMVALWTGKNEKGKKQHDPIIPGKEYDVFDGRKNAVEKRRILTLGHMNSVKRTLERQKKLDGAAKVLKLAHEATTRLKDEVKGAELDSDPEVTAAMKKAAELAESEKTTGPELVKANATVTDLIGKRKLQQSAKKPDADDTATKDDKIEAEGISASTDHKTGDTLPVETKTGQVHLDSIGLERHISAEDAFKLKHLGVLLANLDDTPRRKLSAALDVLINTAYQTNPDLEKKVRNWRKNVA